MAMAWDRDACLFEPEFDVIDESDDWIVVNKPPHLAVHPAKTGQPPTLLEGLEALLCYDIANGARLSIINRLDRETSGLVIAAKHGRAAAALREAMNRGEIAKSYLAIVHGHPARTEFMVDQPILRRGRMCDSAVFVRRMVHPEGKPARTRCEVLGFFGDYSLIRCAPLTGRTHQIRVHLESEGHPIVGDKIYGHGGEAYLDFISGGWSADLANRLLLDRQALHAASLEWDGRRWEAPLPRDMEEFLKKVG